LELKYIFALICAICIYATCFLLPPFLIISKNIKPTEEVEPEIANGILTASAVLFAFSIPKLEKKQKWERYMVIFIILGIELIFLIFAASSYLRDYINFRYTTVATLSSVTSSLMVNAFSFLFYQICQILWGTAFE